jgi:hypothetical protein
MVNTFAVPLVVVPVIAIDNVCVPGVPVTVIP